MERAGAVPPLITAYIKYCPVQFKFPGANQEGGGNVQCLWGRGARACVGSHL